MLFNRTTGEFLDWLIDLEIMINKMLNHMINVKTEKLLPLNSTNLLLIQITSDNLINELHTPGRTHPIGSYRIRYYPTVSDNQIRRDSDCRKPVLSVNFRRYPTSDSIGFRRQDPMGFDSRKLSDPTKFDVIRQSEIVGSDDMKTSNFAYSNFQNACEIYFEYYL